MSSINTAFVSDIDKALAEFDKKNAPTASQRAEINKHLHISKQRDTPTKPAIERDLWTLE